MTLDTTHVRRYLKEFDFESLFIEELGWDNCATSLNVEIDGEVFTLQAVAEKRGVVAFICPVTAAIPPYAIRRKIERQVAQSFRQHFIVYVDGARTEQIWQWVRQELGKPLASREHHYTIQQSGELLIQKLQAIAFSFEEEESLTHVDATSRVRAAFDVERVTKKFYDRFKREHDVLQQFLTGIPDEELEQWYVSVMLNRLMFIYFIQKKGFLNSDPDYLRNKLIQSQLQAVDRFYPDFLCPLFFEGFAKPQDERPPDIRALLGDIPYLNGGIFQRHEVEARHGQTIKIPDAAFEGLFNFFDQYQWHLDDRPLRDDREINPDVLGYIFEKYINQKQMGAYYTKEDITEYISKNTVIPFLFDEAQKKCKIAFEGEHSVWLLLRADPDRYIYDAVKKGVDRPLPEEIAAGINDVSRRIEWNKPAPEDYALPTEIWREVVARRKRYEYIRNRVSSTRNRVSLRNSVSINDLITYNLNIRQFAQDVIENCEGPELLRAFWHAIEQVTVLDPTCGSGAFLFAALNILEPLYEACLDRMQVFLDELARSGEKHRPEKFSDFRKALERVAQHPNRRYFILKSIIVNNLYGVDIMEEAVEICKLRLFLKLVAQIERVENIEPLPDIDFNIRAGNTLVGFATYDEVKRAVTSESTGQVKMQLDDTMQRIDEKAQDVDRLFGLFREMQTSAKAEDAKDFANAKRELLNRLKALEDELNRYLAGEYGIKLPSPQACGEGPGVRWLHSHKPFHWFIEFYGIIKNGGFDVIIGNPPYVEYSKVRKDYTVRGYQTEGCGNLYAFVAERSMSLIPIYGRFGMILPVSGICTDRMKPLQERMRHTSEYLWCSSYAERPSKLFEGVEVQLAITLAQKGLNENVTFTSRYNKWESSYRNALFGTLSYQYSNPFVKSGSIPKIGKAVESGIIAKIINHRETIASVLERNAKYSVYYRNAGGRYYKIVLNFEPLFKLNNQVTASSTYQNLSLANPKRRDVICAVMSSSLFYWHWVCYSDNWHMIMREIASFPLGKMSPNIEYELAKLCEHLMVDLNRNSIQRKEYRNQGRDIVEFTQFIARHSKPIIDEIDRVLAQHYGFTDEELDFIINYDIKYRMGRDVEEEEKG